MPHNHQEERMDALADRIRTSISMSGLCELRQPDLALIWESNEKLPDQEKRLAVQNFALHYKLLAAIDYVLKYAVFR